MSDESRIWIFQADRKITNNESENIKEQAKKFTEQWVSHNIRLTSSVEIYHNLFLVIAVDDKDENPGGCSIDSMTSFVRGLGKKFEINFFDRFKVAVEHNDVIQLMSFEEAGVLAAKDPSLLVFDTLVSNMEVLRTKWKKKFVDSWHVKLV